VLGGAELPLFWGLTFVAALADSALRFASLAKIEDGLESPAAKDRYAGYLEQEGPMATSCVLLELAGAVAFVVLVVRRAMDGTGRLLPAALAAGVMLAAARLGARFIGRKWSAPVLLALLPALYRLCFPLRLLHAAIGRRRAARAAEPEPEVVEAAKEEIRVALEDGTAEGAIEAEEKQMIEGILKFRDVDVKRIMTPRTEIEALGCDTPLPQAIEALKDLHHSRIPVFEDTLDRVVGVVYVKDLLAAACGTADGMKLRDVMREPLFIPETKTIGALLEQFQRQHVQIAMVLDEYGGISGLVTVEDIMEEIVGEIEDEYDQEDQEGRIRLTPSGAVEVDARVRIAELNQMFDLDIPEDDDYDTVGGYVMAHFARVPEPGEEFCADGLRVRILHSDKRRIRRAVLERTGQQSDS